MKPKTVELHLLQSFPPSCINRDGNNSPKDCTFGDVRRARISSQCLKRAIRQSEVFAETVGGEVANRSKRMRDEKLIPHLVACGLGRQEAETTADNFRRELAKDDKKPEQTSVGLYFGDQELFALIDAYRSGDKKWRGAGSAKSADVALFGRMLMLAKARDLSVDAASQVAHAIGTHRLSQEMDYWTAADDLKPTDQEAGDKGADMLGTAEFNASVFYRYACVSLPVLQKNLDDDRLAKKAVEGFLRASWDAIPTGKINGHAHYTPPFLAIAVVRRAGMPLNLCNAFIRPVKPSKDVGLDEASARELVAHLARMRQISPIDDADYYLVQSLESPVPVEGLATLGGYGQTVEAVMEAL